MMNDDVIAQRYRKFYELHRSEFDSLEDVGVKADMNKRNLIESDSFKEYQLRTVLSGLPKCLELGAEEWEVLKVSWCGSLQPAAEGIHKQEVFCKSIQKVTGREHDYA